MNTSSAFISSSSRVAGTAAAAMVAALAGPAAAGGGGEGAVVGGGVVIDLGDRSWKVARVEEVVPVLRELGAALRRDAVAYRDAQLRLGRALVQVRAQVRHGEWQRLVDAIGLNRKTVRACVLRGERWAMENGELDRSKVMEAAKVAGPATLTARLGERGALRVLDGEPSVTDLDRMNGLEREVEGVGAEEEAGGDGAWWDEDELGELDEGDGDDDETPIGSERGASRLGVMPVPVSADRKTGTSSGGTESATQEHAASDRLGTTDARGGTADGSASARADLSKGRRADVAGQAFLTALYDEARAAVAAFLLRMSRGELDEAGVRRVIAVMKGAV